MGGAAAGVVVLGLAQRASAGVSIGVFLETRLGAALLWRGAGLVLAVAGLAVARRGGRRRWRTGMGLVAAGAVVVVVAHVESGHAAARSWPLAMVGLQVVHAIAMTVWIGGLVALLVGLRRCGADSAHAAAARAVVDAGSAGAVGGAGAVVDAGSTGAVLDAGSAGAVLDAGSAGPGPGADAPRDIAAGVPRRGLGVRRPSRAEEPDPHEVRTAPVADTAAAAAARRFSAVAGAALGALVVTGVLRAIDAVGGWGPLFDSGYGQLLLVKSGLLLVLAGLGGINRFRHVPTSGRSLTGLRRVGTSELAVAAGVLLVTGLLTTSPSPDTARPPAAPSAVVLTTSDFGTTVRAALTVSPAQPGENRFTLALADYDSGDPVGADRVTARFALPAFEDASPSTLELSPIADRPGTFAASGTNLSLPGRWTIVLEIERGTDSLALPLELVTRTPPSPATVARAPGQPTIFTVAVAGGRSLQVYADPERPGPTQLHITFFTADGVEEAMGSATMTTDAGSGAATTTPRRLGPGHFVADVTAPSGRWPVAVTGITEAGDYLYTPFDMEIAP